MTTIPTIATLLTGHNSPETAHLTADYPYSFTMRCQRREWLETRKGHGTRFCTQTTNPKRGDKWNAPKKSTYAAVIVMYLDTEGHVQHESIGFYSRTEDIDAFVTLFDAALSLGDRGTIAAMQAAIARQKQYTYTMTMTTYPA